VSAAISLLNLGFSLADMIGIYISRQKKCQAREKTRRISKGSEEHQKGIKLLLPKG